MENNTVTIEFKVPKEGDSLPFEVAEIQAKGMDRSYKVRYETDGAMSINGDKNHAFLTLVSDMTGLARSIYVHFSAHVPEKVEEPAQEPESEEVGNSVEKPENGGKENEPGTPES